MASRGVFSWSVAMLLVGMVAGAAAATKHVVGGTTGWAIPPNSTFYPDWAASQTFVVGDSLVFNFVTGAHNVIEVSKSDYDACTSTKPIGSTISSGPATVTISSAGQHYYICGVTGHCSGGGQKLAITVTGSSTTAPTPATGGLAPAGSTPTTTPSPESAPGPSSTKGSSSATSLASSLPVAVALSLAFGFLI